MKTEHARVKDRPIPDLFQTDGRAQDFSVTAGDMVFDYSKTNIDADTRDALIDMVNTARVAEKRDAMFAGAPINDTEGRAVLHTALRNLDGGAILVDGQDVMPEIRNTLERMAHYADQVRSGTVTDVVNIGIGGSDLGPAMAVQALSPYHDGPRCHFVSNVDGAHIADTLRSSGCQNHAWSSSPRKPLARSKP